jgi:DNA-binding MarR family transcriptional regulator
MAGERKPDRDAFASFPASPPILEDLREIVQLSGEFERHLGRVLGVNSTDLTAMEHLIESGPLSPSELARRLQVSTAASTLVVDRLEASGHAVRQRHGDDRRKVVVVPSPDSARRAADELLPVVRGVAQLLVDLAPEEADAVARFLHRVVGVYRGVLDSADSSA